jgi:hypothetical protein
VQTEKLTKEAIYIVNSSKYSKKNYRLSPALQLTYGYSFASRSSTKIEIQNLKGGTFNEPAFNTISINLCKLNAGPKEQVYFGVLGSIIDEGSPTPNRKGLYLAYGLSRLSILDKVKFLSGSPVKLGFLLGFSCWSPRALDLVLGQEPLSRGIVEDMKEYFKLPIDKTIRFGELSFTYGLKLNIALNKFFSIDLTFINITASYSSSAPASDNNKADTITEATKQFDVIKKYIAPEGLELARVMWQQEVAAAKQEMAAVKQAMAAAKKKYEEKLAALFAWGKLLSLNLSFTLG